MSFVERYRRLTELPKAEPERLRASDLVAGLWMGFDRPKKIKANAQGGILAAPAWTSFMSEVYRRKPAPRDWAMPPDIVARQVDVSTNMLFGSIVVSQTSRN